MDQTETPQPAKKRPIWPWIVLLLLTLWVIYAYNHVMGVIEDVIHEMPPEIIELFRGLLDESRPPGMEPPRRDGAIGASYAPLCWQPHFISAQCNVGTSSSSSG